MECVVVWLTVSVLQKWAFGATRSSWEMNSYGHEWHEANSCGNAQRSSHDSKHKAQKGAFSNEDPSHYQLIQNTGFFSHGASLRSERFQLRPGRSPHHQPGHLLGRLRGCNFEYRRQVRNSRLLFLRLLISPSPLPFPACVLLRLVIILIRTLFELFGHQSPRLGIDPIFPIG